MSTMRRETRIISATEAKRHLGQVFDRLPDNDFVVSRYGKPGVVILSCERYGELKRQAGEPIRKLSDADESAVS